MFFGPGGPCWRIYQAAATLKTTAGDEARAVMAGGPTQWFLKRATNYTAKGLPKDAVWSRLQAIRFSTNLTRADFSAQSGEILREFRDIPNWKNGEALELVGYNSLRTSLEESKVQTLIDNIETDVANLERAKSSIKQLNYILVVGLQILAIREPALFSNLAGRARAAVDSF